jgi:hypothetical protein
VDIFKKLITSAKTDKENIRTKMRYVWLTIARDAQLAPLAAKLEYNQLFEEYFELVNDGSPRNILEIKAHRELIEKKADECLALVEAHITENNITAVTERSEGILGIIGEVN